MELHHAAHARPFPGRQHGFSADVPAGGMRNVVFVDADIVLDDGTLQALRGEAEVVRLSADQDGLSQLAHHLDGRRDVAAVHLIAHGAPGKLWMGALELELATLDSQAATWRRIGDSLAEDGCLMLYGCSTGAGEVGATFVRRIAELAGVAVAASTGPTGAAHLGGHWDLSYRTGAIAAEPLSAQTMAGFRGLLAVPADENYDSNSGASFTADTFTLDGIKYTITGSNPGNYTNIVSNNSAMSLLGNNAGDYFMFFDLAGAFGISSIKVEVADGSAFRLSNLSFDAAADINIAITPSGGAALSYSSNGALILQQNINVSGNAAFQNITSFTISGGNLSLALDDLDFEPALSSVTPPSALTLATASDSGTPGDGITNAVTPTITGTAQPNVTVRLYDSDGATLLGTATANGSGAWSIGSSALSEGVHTLTAKATDISSNVSAASSVLSLTIDVTPPAAPAALALAVGSDSGALGDLLTNDNTPAVTGTAAANATVTLYDSDGTTVLGTATANGSGAWSITSSVLSDAAHTLTAKQSDAAGNASAASTALILTIDTAAPAAPAGLVLASASDSGTPGDGITNDSTPTVTGSAAGNASVTLYDSDGTTVLGTATADGSGAWSVTSSALSTGAHTLTAKQLDSAGNASPASSTLTLNIQTSAAAPTALVLATASDSATLGDGVTNDSTPTVTGSAGANAAVTLYDSDGTTVLGNATADGTGAWSITSSALAGSHTVTARQTDVAGNVSAASAGLSLAIDTVPPLAPAALTLAVASDSGTLGDLITNDNTPTVTGSADANATVTLYDSDGTTPLGTATANGSGAWSITSSALSSGSHTLTAKQSDVAGNSSPASAALALSIVTVALPPSALTLASASDGGTAGDLLTNDSTPTITGSAVANASVTLYDSDGTTVLGTATADGSGAWSITSSALSDAAHTLTAKQTDVAGNVSAASGALTLTIDTASPDSAAAPVLAEVSDSGTPGDGITNDSTPLFAGTADANARVTLYDSDGTTVLGAATADGSGAWSITSSALALGMHSLTVKQSDAAGNSSPASAVTGVTIVAPPAPPPPPTPPAANIDGVDVVVTPVTLPGGGSGTMVNIPIVTAGRQEQSGSPGLADIPLVSQNSNTLLLAQMPVGYGLTATGGVSAPAGDPLEQLIAAIRASTPSHVAADQGHLTDNGRSFLGLLPASVPLLVETIVLSGGASGTGPALELTGTSSATQHTALVIDVRQLPPERTIVLNDVDFAAVIGSANVVGGAAGQILTGDAASQGFDVAANSGAHVFAGGGGDIMRFAPAAPSVSSASAPAMQRDAAAPVVSTLHGGAQADSAVFSGQLASYQLAYHEGFVLVSSKDAPGQQAKVINVESLTFADTTLAVENRVELTAIAGLYQTMFGRQADVGGMDFWGAAQRNHSMGQLALSMLDSDEARVLGYGFNGDFSHDVDMLYTAILDRSAEAAGHDYWVGKLQQGMTMEQVATGFVLSVEMVGHYRQALEWDFLL